MPAKTDWTKAIQPLLKKYKNKKHPLEYKSVYQLVVMVILSAQDSDRHINQLAPKLFESYPDMKALSKVTVEELYRYIGSVRNFASKAEWLVGIAQKIKDNKNIPLTLDALTELKGIGRKSANVILRESGKPAEGVIVDLHVVRVSSRLGIATGTDPKKLKNRLWKYFLRKIGMPVWQFHSLAGRFADQNQFVINA